MATIDWSGKFLTDSELVKRIEALPEDVECKELVLYRNHLHNVPNLTKYKQFAGLTRLHFGNNGLTFVQPEHLPPSLTHLVLFRNKLSEVPNLSQFVNLQQLDLQENHLSVVHPEFLPASLTHLDLSRNKLTEVSDFSQCVHLQELKLSFNNHSDVQQGLGFYGVTHHVLSRNRQTEVSDCVKLHFAQELLPPSLTHLDLSGNNLTEVPDFSECLNLQILDLSHNNLTVAQPEHLPPSLTHLYLLFNKLTEVPDFSQFANLQKLNLHNINLSVVQTEHLPPNLAYLDLSLNRLTEVPDFSQCVKLHELNLQKNNLSVIQQELLPTNLTHLKLYENKLTEVPNFSQCVHLQELDLSRSRSNLSVVQPGHLPPSLTDLHLSGNKLTEVPDFSQCVKLQELELSDNNLVVVKPEYLPPSLTLIHLGNNKLTEMPDFSHCVKLENLYLWENNLSVVNSELLPPSLIGLHLSNLKLTEVPDLSHCVKLQKLELSENNISVVQPELLPPSLTYIHMSGNKLTKVPDLSHCVNLQRLLVHENNLSVVQPDLLPPSLRDLILSSNKLTVLQDFSQHKNLKDLDISDNESLHTIHGLPESLEEFSCHELTAGFMEKSPVEFIKKNAFHENTYKLLRKEISSKSLKQPPYGVYIQGLDAVLDYFTEKSVETTQTSMMLLGPTTAGKTSVMESLISGIPVLVDINKRTQVANIKEWDISHTDTIEVFDQGGHPIYNITNPIFFSASCTRFIVHDITKVEATQLEETSDILIQSLQIHPQSQVHVILAHIDKVDAVCIARHEKMVKEKLEVTIDQEVQNLARLAVSDEKEGVSKEQLSIQLQQQKKGMKYFLVSNKTYEGLNALKDFLTEEIAQKRMQIPEKWVQFYKLMLREKTEYFKVEDLKPIFEPLHSTSEYQEEQVTKLFLSALKHFRNSGLIMYFDNISGLDKYVFHKKTFLVDLFKCCFHHNLMSTIDFKALEKHWQFKRKQAELMVKQYQTEGILSTELLHYLWQKYGLDEKVQKAVLDMMKIFNLCHPINSSEELFFFPWFMQNNECPSRIDPDKIVRCDRRHFSVHLNCKFVCSIPMNCFEVLLVQIQRTALEKHFGDDRHAWKDGLAVKVGTLECVAVRMPQKKIISICVQGHRKKVDEVWQVMFILYSDLKSYLDKFEGVIEEICFTCNHCVIKTLEKPEERPPTKVFQGNPLDLRHTTCQEDEIPSALVYALSAGSRHFKEHIENVEKYLEDNCEDTSPPGKLLYLDCEKVWDGELLISWCWPQSKEETVSGGMDNTITHAVVEYREEEEWTPVTDVVKHSPFSLHCQAKEVRVAAANEYGHGGFSYAKPCHVVDADETLTSSDRQHLKDNHEFFSRMTSVLDVVIRLFSRRVLFDREKEDLIRLVADKDKKKIAASKLMECVQRLTYKQLYLFKKTLIETGQHTMANAVPVKLVAEI